MSVNEMIQQDTRVGDTEENYSRDEDTPVGEKFRQQANPDKQIENIPGSVSRRSWTEQSPRKDVPEIDLTVERLRKSSSMWPEIEEAINIILNEAGEKTASHGMSGLGAVVRDITESKIAAAYARCAVEGGSTPHVHVVRDLWKSSVWNGSVVDPGATLKYEVTPSMSDDEWEKLAASRAIIERISPGTFNKMSWQSLIGNNDLRSDFIGLCGTLVGLEKVEVNDISEEEESQ